MLLEGLSRSLIKYWVKVNFWYFGWDLKSTCPKECNPSWSLSNTCYHQGLIHVTIKLQLGMEWENRMQNQFCLLFVYVMRKNCMRLLPENKETHRWGSRVNKILPVGHNWKCKGVLEGWRALGIWQNCHFHSFLLVFSLKQDKSNSIFFAVIPRT